MIVVYRRVPPIKNMIRKTGTRETVRFMILRNENFDAKIALIIGNISRNHSKSFPVRAGSGSCRTERAPVGGA
jgi:hypothetical protein